LIANIVNKNVSAKKLSRKKSLSEQKFKQAGIFYAEGIHYSIFNRRSSTECLLSAKPVQA